MTIRRLLTNAALVACAVAAISPHSTLGQETTPPSAAPPGAAAPGTPSRGRFEPTAREPSKFTVIALKYAKATQAVEVLSNLFVASGRGFGAAGQPETIIADPRTNSLVVRAPDDVLQQVIEIVKQLDAPQEAQQLQVFELRHTPASEVHNALQGVVGADVKIAVDAVGNRVIVQGDADTLEVIEALLTRIDQPPPEREPADAPPPAAEDVQVRLVWLVAGLKDSPAAPPPADLENVVQELEKMGVTGLKTAAQVFVKTVPATQFSVSGSAILDQSCSLEVSGIYARRRSGSGPVGAPAARDDKAAAPAVLEISVKASPHLADLQTTITAPEGHSVVLGVSPVGELTSVFVVQMRR
jgi:hypothetical protein